MEPIKLNNIHLPYWVTSLPQIKTYFHPALLFTSVKELALDKKEREQVQKNLNDIHATEIPFKLDLVIEQLARGLAYHLGKQNELIDIPYNNTLVPYKIEEIPLFMGLNAYGLTPNNNTDAPPILLFKGSSFYPSGRGALSSVVADLDPTGIGHLAYQLGASKIKKWFEGKKNVLVTGHSLGAAFATYAAIDNADKVKEVQTHAGVGVSFLYYKKWKNLTNQPKIKNFYHPEDLLVRMGHKRVGDDYCVTPEISENDVPALEKGSFRRKSLNHRISLLDKKAIITKTQVKPLLPVWLQVALVTIPFLFSVTLLIAVKLLIGNYTNPLYSALGFIRAIWHKIAENYYKKLPNNAYSM